jgi:hypothetical protein
MNHDNNMSITLMLIISFVAGYLSTMNIWTVDFKHARWHINDLYMVSLMVAWMIFFNYIIMNNYTTNNIILVIIFVIIIIYAIRSQFLISDKQFLNGMIPHHSMAILMSEKIKNKTKDPRIKKLSMNIIKSQTDEINLMTNILNETNNNNYIF